MRDRGIIYKAAEQKIIIYGSKSWVVMGEMLKVLEGFHHWKARRIAAMTDRSTEDG